MDALGDIRVIELATGVAGPIVGMFCADFGADVVKVETPDGDPERGRPGFPMWNRGKRSVVIDPRSAEGRAWLRNRIGGADMPITRDGGEPAALGLVGAELPERKRGVKGTGVAVRVDLGGTRINKQKRNTISSTGKRTSKQQRTNT